MYSFSFLIKSSLFLNAKIKTIILEDEIVKLDAKKNLVKANFPSLSFVWLSVIEFKIFALVQRLV